jgi:hypothetical protein
MRKHQQRKIIELLKTVAEAQEYGMYADCQSAAISIVQFIEDIEDNRTHSVHTVALLHEYNELLYKASCGNIDTEALRRHLKRVDDSVRVEMRPNRVEVVFLPYQLSMFDSLESVFLAARADPSCDAYVVPIPWYDRTADGSLANMHYDGGEYPKNIEITHYSDYDVETRHPDVIFIHNPYDDGNYVTSVHPDYYARKLKDFTELLCYIPYFVNTHTVNEQMVVTYGSAYAHKVFVQSRNIKDTYVRIFEEKYGNEYGEPVGKFVALGSPKFDKVINSVQSKLSMPEEWKGIINGKKTILFNTTVTAILNGNEMYIDKLALILDVFKNQADYVLWWRPHPLSLETYRSMRPRLLKSYEKLVEQYRDSAFGIYDDTHELQRAISYTDGYYGDYSSLLALYGITGKPILVSNAVGKQKISPDPIDLARLVVSATPLLRYYEKNTNTLSLFLREFSIFESQNKERAELHKAITENADGTCGKKIYDYVRSLFT